MTKIKNKLAYPLKNPVVQDYFVGTDSEQAGKTVSFSFENTAALMNAVNGNLIIDYLFSTNPDIAGEVLIDGKFLTNDNVTNVDDVTKFYVNRNTHSGTDMQQLFEFIKNNKESFVFRFTDKANTQSVAYFSITDIEEFPAYFVFDVSIKIDSFDTFDLQNFQLYTIAFDFNTALDIDVSGKLDKGGYEGTAKDLDDKINNVQNINLIRFDAGFSLESGLFIGNIGTLYNVDGTDCEITAFQNITIDLASTGFKKFYRIVLLNDNTMARVDGEEDAENPAVPPVPDNAIAYTIIFVDDSDISEPTPPLIGGDYITKIEKQNITQDISIGGSAIFLPGPSANITITGEVEDIHYVSTPANAYLYAGRKLTLKNGTDHNIILRHLGVGSAFMFRFPEEQDFTWKPNEVIEFSLKITGTNTGFYDYIGIGLSKEYVDGIQYTRISATNKTGTTIPKGSVVYINGAQGSNPTIALSLGDTSDITSRVTGITSAAIPNNTSGYVYTNGLIEGLDTSGFAEGDVLFLSPTIPGGITDVVPVSPNRVVFLGTCVREHAVQGKILIDIQSTVRLDRLRDVSVDGATTGQLLYKDADGNWKAKTLTPADIDSYTQAEIDGKDADVLTSAYQYADALVVGLWDDRGNFTPAGSYPTTGGSGPSGAVYKGDTWVISGLGAGVTNTLPGSVIVSDGDVIRALSNTPGQTASNWSATENNLNYVPENVANKTDDIATNSTSSTKYTSVKAVYDWVTSLFVRLTRKLKINGNEYDLSADRSWRAAMADTGALTYGGITIASSTTVNIGACTGVIVDNETTPGTPTFIEVNYAGETGKTVTTIGTGTGTYVLLKSVAGVPTIHFQNTYPTTAERKTMIYLSKLSHPDSVSLSFKVDEVDFINSPLQQFRDVFQAFQYINIGIIATANSNLTFKTNTGSILGDGINFVNDKTKPNTLPVNAQDPCSFLALNQSGAGGSFVTTVDPTVYDVGGVTTTIAGSNNQATIKYLFYAPGVGYALQRGQTVYSTIAEAIAAFGKEVSYIVRPNLVANAIPIGCWVMTKGCTDLSNTATARFLPADKFGQLGGASGGISTATQQSAYTNSGDPEITTDSVRGAFSVKRGSAADTDNIYEGVNGAGSTTWSVDGNGKNTATSFVKSGGTATQQLMADGSVKTVGSIIKTRKDVTGTTYTLLAADVDKILYTTNASGCVITVPAGLTTLQEYEILQYTTGAVTFVTSGTTLKYQDYEIAATGQINSRVTLSWIDTEIYQLIGQLSMI